MFLDYIAGNSVIFGRKTYGYFSKKLPAKQVFVVTGQNITYKNAETCDSLDKAIERAALFDEDIYIAGGGAIYEQALDKADKMYLSYIKGDFKGDTYFPEFDKNEWTLEQRTDHPLFEFVIYSKK
jgi:dihydrofolate reductase